eukprot:1369612-Amorphochlora_amoeboformis.AAC.1
MKTQGPPSLGFKQLCHATLFPTLSGSDPCLGSDPRPGSGPCRYLYVFKNQEAPPKPLSLVACDPKAVGAYDWKSKHGAYY